MLELELVFFDVARYREIHPSFGVIPIKGDTVICFALPTKGTFVVIFKRLDEV